MLLAEEFPRSTAANRAPLRRVVQDQFRDSTQWDEVTARPDDLVIGSCYKSGTTLTQQIITLLIYQSDEFSCIQEASPWVDLAMFPLKPERIEALPSPRLLKTHLPFDALPAHEGWRYIYLARDGRDVCLSLFNHCQSHLVKVDRAGRPIDNGSGDFTEFFDQWLETGHPRWAYWENIASWWQVRHEPNVLLLHYADLVNDKPNQIGRIARFLGVRTTPELLGLVQERSSFEYMKANHHKFERPGSFKPGSFINQGKNGRWQDLLSAAQVQRYLDVIHRELAPACAAWIMHGDRALSAGGRP